MRWLANRFGGAVLALALVATLLLGSVVAADTLHSAGLVVRHDDGTLIYVLVTFSEESISSEELLLRSGLAAEVTPFGGMGGAVCSLDGEGCPSTDCFCKSYTSPAYFWHFYTWQDGSWVIEPRGPASRQVHDGDIDGWSWTSDDGQLPSVTLAGIRELANSQQQAESTATPAATVPPETPTEPPTAVAVVISPDGTPVAHVSTSTKNGDANVLIFAAMAIAVVLVGGLVVLRRRNPRAP